MFDPLWTALKLFGLEVMCSTGAGRPHCLTLRGSGCCVRALKVEKNLNEVIMFHCCSYEDVYTYHLRAKHVLNRIAAYITTIVV